MTNKVFLAFMIFACLCGFIFVKAKTLPFEAYTSAETLNMQISMGDQLYEDGNVSGAKTVYSNALATLLNVSSYFVGEDANNVSYSEFVEAAKTQNVRAYMQFYLKGMSAFQDGGWDSAVSNFTQSISWNHVFPPSYLFRAVSYKSQGKMGLAIADLDFLIDTYSDFNFPYQLKAEILFNNEAYSNALECLSHVTAFNLVPHEFVFLRGRIYRALGSNELALVDFNQAISLSEKVFYHFIRGEFLYSLEQYDQALSDLLYVCSQEEEETPRFYEACWRVVEIYAQKKDYPQCLVFLDRLIKAYPEDLWANRKKIAALGCLERYEEALQWCEKYLTLDGQDAEIQDTLRFLEKMNPQGERGQE